MYTYVCMPWISTALGPIRPANGRKVRVGEVGKGDGGWATAKVKKEKQKQEKEKKRKSQVETYDEHLPQLPVCTRLDSFHCPAPAAVRGGPSMTRSPRPLQKQRDGGGETKERKTSASFLVRSPSDALNREGRGKLGFFLSFLFLEAVSSNGRARGCPTVRCHAIASLVIIRGPCKSKIHHCNPLFFDPNGLGMSLVSLSVTARSPGTVIGSPRRSVPLRHVLP